MVPPNASNIAAFEAGQKAWPGVRLSPDQFVARIARIDLSDRTLLERAQDLFLACACAEGDSEAIRYFESEILSRVGLYVARFGLSSHVVDEVRQRVRVKVLVGTSPGIAGYRGQGPLRAWVQITAVRIAMDISRSTAASRASVDVDLADLVISLDDSPELAAARGLYRERLQTALEESLRALEARDKTLLHLSLVDGLNIDAIGALYRVHRATVARWLVAIQSRIFQSVRARLGLRGTPSPSETRSLVALLRDDIHLSLGRLLVSQRRPG